MNNKEEELNKEIVRLVVVVANLEYRVKAARQEIARLYRYTDNIKEAVARIEQPRDRDFNLNGPADGY